MDRVYYNDEWNESKEDIKPWVDFISWEFEKMFKDQLLYGESSFNSEEFNTKFKEYKNNLKINAK